jgi:glycosyltransferase involved in cell wall biosynthesis
MKTDLSISLVLPGYNEEENIEEAVEKCLAELSSLTEKYEIILIDDASTDRTVDIANRLSARYDTVRVIHNPVNLGVGINILIGLYSARHDIVIHNVMDLPFAMSDLAKVLPHFEQSDVVIVARTNRKAHSPWRKLTSLVNYYLIRLLFRVHFGDMNFVQAYRRSVLASIRTRAKRPAFVTPELLIRAQDQGFRIAEVRTEFHRRERGKASYGRPHDILWTLADMIAFWLKRTLHIG